MRRTLPLSLATAWALLTVAAAPAHAHCPIAFSAPTHFPTGPLPNAVAVGDFNLDQRLDLAVANNGNSTVSILLGNGNGTFQAGGTLTAAAGPFAIAVGDFNGDMRPDVVVANQSNASISLFLGNGNGLFQAAVTTPAGALPSGIGVAHFNADGNLDVVVANGNASTISVLLGNGNGSFQAPVAYGVGSQPSCIAIGDFNVDGRPDVAVGNRNNFSRSVSILFGNGNGTLQAPVNYTVAIGPWSITAGDFNGDGRLDLATANADSNNVSVLINSGNGTFMAAVNYAAPTQPVAIANADFDSDGHPDLAVGSDNGSYVSLLRGLGDGTFQQRITTPSGTGGRGLAVGDFNADSRPDIATANRIGNNLSVLLNSPNPANDSCAGAQLVVDHQFYTGTLCGATNDGVASCGSTQSAPDVWYRYIAPVSGVMTASTCAYGAHFDTVVSIHALSCNGVELDCNDEDDCGHAAVARAEVSVGVTYYIRVAGFAGAVDHFGIAFWTDSPEGNDPCTGATPIAEYDDFDYDNADAFYHETGQGNAACFFLGTSAINNDIWFRWTAPETSLVRVHTCNQTTFDTKIAVYANASCASLGAPLACNDSSCGLQASVSFSAVYGRDYLIQIGNSPGTEPGVGSFTIEDGDPCPFDFNDAIDTQEEEEDCGAHTNDGCSGSKKPQYEDVQCDGPWDGTLFALAGDIDVDAYRFSVPTGRSISITLNSALPVAMRLYREGCDSSVISSAESFCGSTGHIGLSVLGGASYVLTLAPGTLLSPTTDGLPCLGPPINGYTVDFSLGINCPSDCPCDFDGSGALNSQDFFDFLGAFFNDLPIADFNGDLQINSQDFFDFLACFFSGCPRGACAGITGDRTVCVDDPTTLTSGSSTCDWSVRYWGTGRISMTPNGCSIDVEGTRRSVYARDISVRNKSPNCWRKKRHRVHAVEVQVIRESTPHFNQGPNDANVGQWMKFKGKVRGPLVLRAGALYEWSLSGGMTTVLQDYEEDPDQPYSTTPGSAIDLTRRRIEFYWLPDPLQVHPRNEDVTRRVTFTATLDNGSNSISVECSAVRDFRLERNRFHQDNQAEDFYAGYNHREKHQVQGDGRARKRKVPKVLWTHSQWHSNNPPPDCANIPVAEAHGVDFWEFHRRVLQRFDSWRSTFGYPPIEEWDPAGPLPTGIDVSHSARNATYVPMARYQQLICSPTGGVNIPLTAQCFGNNLANLDLWPNAGQLGYVAEGTYHNERHGAIGGDMGLATSAPSDPVFWRYHLFLDQRIYQCYLNSCPGGPACP